MFLVCRFLFFFCLIVFILGALERVEAADPMGDWSYDEATGPSTWPNHFPHCGGKMQSPININTEEAKYDGSLTDLDIKYPNTTDVLLVNHHGHAIEADILSSEPFVATGADLSSRYRLAQFHFHVGSSDIQGSEHHIHGVKYPLEMHLVHYNDKYPNASSAQGLLDGLAVISVLFESSSTDNPALNEIIDNLQNASYKDEEITVQNVPVGKIIPTDTEKFYRYNGSLTTPPCFETVKWIVLKKTASISEKQLRQFRSVFSTSRQATKPNSLVDNFRPTQSLNGRIIRKNFDEPHFPCGKTSNLTADCRQYIDGKAVFYEVQVNPCTLPVSVTLKIHAPGFDYQQTVSQDIRTPLKIGALDKGMTMEIHYHADGEMAGKMHVSVFQVNLPFDTHSDNIVKVIDEFFHVEGLCKPANCTIDSWDKHWCTATIGYGNDTLHLGFSSILFDQCSTSPSMRVKIYRQEEKWVWASEKTFKNNDIETVGLTGTILKDMGMKRSAPNTQWSPVTLESFITHFEGTTYEFKLYLVTKDNGGQYIMIKDRYTYPRNICTSMGGSDSGRKIAIGVSVVLVVVIMIAVAIFIMYRKRKMFLGHRPALVEEMDVYEHDAGTL